MPYDKGTPGTKQTQKSRAASDGTAYGFAECSSSDELQADNTAGAALVSKLFIYSINTGNCAIN